MATCKISKLVKRLNLIKEVVGDIDVFLSCDSEGNGFSTIEPDQIGCAEDSEFVVIYPFEEGLGYEELGYVGSGEGEEDDN